MFSLDNGDSTQVAGSISSASGCDFESGVQNHLQEGRTSWALYSFPINCNGHGGFYFGHVLALYLQKCGRAKAVG